MSGIRAANRRCSCSIFSCSCRCSHLLSSAPFAASHIRCGPVAPTAPSAANSCSGNFISSAASCSCCSCKCNCCYRSSSFLPLLVGTVAVVAEPAPFVRQPEASLPCRLYLAGPSSSELQGLLRALDLFLLSWLFMSLGVFYRLAIFRIATV